MYIKCTILVIGLNSPLLIHTRNYPILYLKFFPFWSFLASPPSIFTPNPIGNALFCFTRTSSTSTKLSTEGRPACKRVPGEVRCTHNGLNTFHSSRELAHAIPGPCRETLRTSRPYPTFKGGTHLFFRAPGPHFGIGSFTIPGRGRKSSTGTSARSAMVGTTAIVLCHPLCTTSWL